MVSSVVLLLLVCLVASASSQEVLHHGHEHVHDVVLVADDVAPTGLDAARTLDSLDEELSASASSSSSSSSSSSKHLLRNRIAVGYNSNLDLIAPATVVIDEALKALQADVVSCAPRDVGIV